MGPSLPGRPRRRQRGDLAETVALAWSSLLANRMRSALTMLGVIIGIGAVISMVTIGRGAQLQTENQLKSLGSNLLFVQSGVAAGGGPVSRGAGSATTLIWDDARAIAASCAAVADVAPNLSRRSQVVLGERNTSTTIVGTTPAYEAVRDFLPLSGRFFNEAELNQAARVAVLGQTVVDSLGLTAQSALDRMIRIRGETFTVIGTLEYKGSTGFRDQDDQVLIPLTTMASRIVGVNTTAGVSVDSIAVSARSAESMEAAEYQITNLLRLRHRIVPPRDDDFFIRNQADLVNASNAVANVFTALLGGSAAISLLVGGIGIMNIMLVSVTERTREIGIRRAIGARCSDILRQFLIESTVLSLAGGLLGVLLGVVASLAINAAFGWSSGIAVDAVGWSLAFCLLIGVFFGAYPANRAAQLDPMTALRSD
ncbi:ABC transporter permease [Synechococcus sp. CBW1107]|uniref:ABC transporter permease n=1 Tax=Synechococcus sp. CBW1107 TaxID=2789857 RepID=UPI0018CE69B0|nr:ABC transporter permease [Synechococcus sp. CBW1107]QPN57293.1 ABC transporter permease [Synechococcus sp. CBW1107]CAK6693217.1 Macrolide export ATP-binding/permease protein MacB [Synechococcus sp. CBW1107]